MEYKVGDIVELKIENEICKVEIIFIYEVYMGIGIANSKIYDGKILKNNEVVTFNIFDILKKINKIESIEEKKYLKTWEAIKALEEGFKIAKKSWINNPKTIFKYWYMDEFKKIRRENGVLCELSSYDSEDWYIYEEPKKEIPKEFEGLKYILGSINNMDCDDKDCDKCPLGIDKCDMLDEIFFDMKGKYNF